MTLQATTSSTIFMQKICNEDHFPSKVACLSHIIVIDNIKKNLNETQLEMFKKSCFGHFLGMTNLKFSAQIVHNMLLRQCDIKREDEMWILVYSKGLRFSASEFALITGLKFGNISQFDLTSLRIRDQYFNGENKIRNNRLEEVFISLCKKGKRTSTKRTKKKAKLSGKSNLDEDIVKLALLYFVEHVLLGKEGKNLIDLQWVQLVDSLEEFNKYPWGRICYERTLFGLQRALDKRQSKYVEKKKKRGMQPMKHMHLWDFHMPFKFGHMKSFHCLE